MSKTDEVAITYTKTKHIKQFHIQRCTTQQAGINAISKNYPDPESNIEVSLPNKIKHGEKLLKAVMLWALPALQKYSTTKRGTVRILILNRQAEADKFIYLYNVVDQLDSFVSYYNKTVKFLKKLCMNTFNLYLTSTTAKIN